MGPDLELTGMIRVSSIHVYPLKATRGLSLESAVVEPQGLRMDRRWMLVGADGVFLSQRTVPKLALIETEPLDGDGLHIRVPGQEPLVVSRPPGDKPVSVRIWNDTVEAAEAGPEARNWFSRFIGKETRLVFLDDPTRRAVRADYAAHPDDVVSFADGFPVLLLSTASLEALNEKLKVPVPMDRFRPNLVISGCDPFEEDAWSRVRIGNVSFHVAKASTRCVVTTVDQRTATCGKEPLRTLNTFRRRDDGKVYFGQNLIPLTGGTVRRGDPVEATMPAMHSAHDS